MPVTIDVSGLDEQDVSLVKALIERLKQKARRKRAPRGIEKEEVEKELIFSTHHSNVIGKLTRKEIYEDL
jgi:hypothetical protein